MVDGSGRESQDICGKWQIAARAAGDARDIRDAVTEPKKYVVELG